MAYVLIPTINESPYLRELLEVVLSDDATDKIILTVNVEESFGDLGLGDLERSINDDRIERWNTSSLGKSIYHGWRFGIAKAKEDGKLLAILNDDIRFTCENPISMAEIPFMEDLELAVLGYNYGPAISEPKVKYVYGSYRHGGVGGAAFMVDPQICPLPDPKYQHWYGEDSMFINCDNIGIKMAVANRLTYDHVSETTARNHLWTFEARAQDRILWEQEHGIGTG